jgi:hypothetical protein
LSLLVGFLFVGLACNSHELNPFASAIQVAKVEKTEQSNVRTVDILFVVDNSSSMCEEQFSLQANFNTFIEDLVDFGANFNLAVVNTDMSDTLGGIGRFRTTPGTYKENISKCTAVPPPLEYCDALPLPSYLESDEYKDEATGEIDVARLQREFSCMALTGIDGDGIEMGLETMSRALTGGVNSPDFFRQNSMLAIVFVADENDCSDTTFGELKGEVYQTGDAGCEYNRNLEDSCIYAREDDGTSLNEGPLINYEGERKTARQWCREGDPKVMNALQDSLEVLCPNTGCTNKLKRRLTYYNTVVELVARRNGICKEGAVSCKSNEPATWANADREDLDFERAASDVIVAVIINPDKGVRYLESEEIEGAVCGDAGTAGYRYQLFAEMFPANRRVIFPICENNSPTSFAQALGEISTIIGKAINSICLRSRPMTCNVDADCPEEQSCVGPNGQADAEYLAGTDYAFRLCSGFKVRVEKERADGTRTLMREGVDYTVNFTQCSYIAPVGLNLVNPPAEGESLIVSYPSVVGLAEDE